MIDPRRIAAAATAFADALKRGSKTPIADTANETGVHRKTLERWKREGRLIPPTDEQLQAAARAYQETGSRKAAAVSLELDYDVLCVHLRIAAERGLLGFSPVLPGFKVIEVKTQQDADGNAKGHSVRQVADGGEQEDYVVPEGWRSTKATVHVKDGKVVQVWDRIREGEITVEETARRFQEAFKGFEGRAQPKPSIIAPKRSLVNLYPCNDWHVGMFSWARETGTNWDLRIAEQAIGQGIVDTIHRTPMAPTSIILGGGDLVHADNNGNVTARSHNKLDVDGRHQKVVETAGRLMVLGIDTALERSERVVVRNLKGNHDEETSSKIAWFLYAWYRNEPRVTIDCDESLFWFWDQGLLMLAGTHGHEVKPAQMPMIMAHRRPEIWGRTRFRYAHNFHVHHASKFATEGDGVISETHQAPIPQDAWHYGAGFLSGRSLQGITYDDRYGEIARARTAMLDAEGEAA